MFIFGPSQSIGPRKPVLVQFKSDRNECTLKDCVTARNLSYHHTSDKNFICKHMKSIIHFKESGASLEDTDLFSEQCMKDNPDKNDADVGQIGTLIRGKLQSNSPIVRSFEPSVAAA